MASLDKIECVYKDLLLVAIKRTRKGTVKKDVLIIADVAEVVAEVAEVAEEQLK